MLLLLSGNQKNIFFLLSNLFSDCLIFIQHFLSILLKCQQLCAEAEEENSDSTWCIRSFRGNGIWAVHKTS